MSIRKGNKIIAGSGGSGDGDSIKNQNLVSPITKVYDWIGTLEEYEDQQVAELHPTWVCFILDDTTPKDKNLYTNRNVGDIFFTTRLDEILNGAVECDGNTYSFEDFTGEQSIGNLLKDGKIPYVSLSEYATLLNTNGVVGVFGWDGGNDVEFRVPTIKDVFLEAGEASEIGEFLPQDVKLPNITGTLYYAKDTSFSSNPTLITNWTQNQSGDGNQPGLSGSMSTLRSGYGTFDASRSSVVYSGDGTDTLIQPKSIKYRAMVQLSIGFTDEAVETCLEVREDVAEAQNEIEEVKNDITELKEYDYVIDWQVPNAENNYVWYRKYKSGWVEQGGYCYASGSAAVSISYPIELTRAEIPLTNPQYSYESQVFLKGIQVQTVSTTGFTCRGKAVSSSNAVWENSDFCWQVSGMAAE